MFAPEGKRFCILTVSPLGLCILLLKSQSRRVTRKITFIKKVIIIELQYNKEVKLSLDLQPANGCVNAETLTLLFSSDKIVLVPVKNTFLREGLLGSNLEIPKDSNVSSCALVKR